METSGQDNLFLSYTSRYPKKGTLKFLKFNFPDGVRLMRGLLNTGFTVTTSYEVRLLVLSIHYWRGSFKRSVDGYFWEWKNSKNINKMPTFQWFGVTLAAVSVLWLPNRYKPQRARESATHWRFLSDKNPIFLFSPRTKEIRIISFSCPCKGTR